MESLVLSPERKPIGKIISSGLGWRAIAFPGSTDEEIDQVMDAVDPLFTRLMESKRRYAELRPKLQLVRGGR
jgi:hypothetical protein